MGKEERVAVNNCGFNDARMSNYLEEEIVSSNEAETQGKKLNNVKAAGKNEVTGEMIKNECKLRKSRSRNCFSWLLRTV